MNIISNKIKNLSNPYLGLPKEIYVIFIARVINAMGVLVFPLLTLILTVKLGMTKGEAGFWISISGLMFGPAAIIGGKITDIIGRKIIIVIFDSLGALSYLSITFMEPSISMIYMIMLAGFFMGIAHPAHDALIADLTTPENRSGAYSLSYLGFNLGFIIGPVLGGFLFTNYFHLIFLIDGLTALIAAALVLFFIKETIGKTKEKMDEGRELEERVEGSIFKVLLSRPILLYFALISFGYAFVYSQWSFMIPIHAEHIFADKGVELYGQIAGFNGFIVIVFTPILTSLFSKKKNIRRIIYGGILYTIGFGMLGFVSSKTAFFTSALIFTLGEILIVISSTPFIVNHTPASHRGRMNSVLPLIIGLGHTLGPVIMGNILDIIPISVGWKYIGIIMLTFTTLMLLVERIDNKNSKQKQQENSKKDLAVTG